MGKKILWCSSDDVLFNSLKGKIHINNIWNVIQQPVKKREKIEKYKYNSWYDVNRNVNEWYMKYLKLWDV